MASNSSGDLSPSESYTLGQYTFTIDSQYDSEGDTTYITADCSYGEDAGIKQTTVDGEAELVSWHVECSDDAADIYALVNKKIPGSEHTSGLDTSPVEQPIHCGGKVRWEWKTAKNKPVESTRTCYNYNTFTFLSSDLSGFATMVVSKTPDTEVTWVVQTDEYEDKVVVRTETLVPHRYYTYDGKTAYYSVSTITAYQKTILDIGYNGYVSSSAWGRIAWTILYGESSYTLEPEEVFVARFAINPEDADVEDWDDPIDDGDPELTLKLTVRGALSGRHNDPIYDTSYSYTPADNPTVKDYGCGGDGGYGGGGGAGASTVIINKFSTSQAGSHESYAYARRHGYGSGGGKGGRGGDGCIIIYW